MSRGRRRTVADRGGNCGSWPSPHRGRARVMAVSCSITYACGTRIFSCGKSIYMWHKNICCCATRIYYCAAHGHGTRSATVRRRPPPTATTTVGHGAATATTHLHDTRSATVRRRPRPTATTTVGHGAATAATHGHDHSRPRFGHGHDRQIENTPRVCRNLPEPNN